MRQALCYRVETSTAKGMYRDSAGDFESDWRLHDDNRHPTPSRDAALNWNPSTMGAYSLDLDWVFGFSSIDQMRRWLYHDGIMKSMPDYDLAISIYLCDEYRIGDTQMIFRPSKSTKVGRFNLED